jgi:CRP-like cAMP-binding protein
MNPFTLIEKAFFLKKTSLFSEVDLDLVLAVSDKAAVAEFQDGEEIFSKNQDAHRLYIILQGEVILSYEGEEVRVLGPQDFFGDEALFGNGIRGYSARAKGQTIVMTISRTHLIEIILESPQVAIALLRAFAQEIPFRRKKI